MNFNRREFLSMASAAAPTILEQIEKKTSEWKVNLEKQSAEYKFENILVTVQGKFLQPSGSKSGRIIITAKGQYTTIIELGESDTLKTSQVNHKQSGNGRTQNKLSPQQDLDTRVKEALRELAKNHPKQFQWVQKVVEAL